MSPKYDGVEVKVGEVQEKGKLPATITANVPPDQIWLYYKHKPIGT
jgi:hypothetical protein